MYRQAVRSNAGYSYVELVIVIQIMAILAAVAVPKFVDALHYHRAESAARRVAISIQLLRSAARMGSAARSVTFDVTANSFTLFGIADPDHPSRPDYTVQLDESLSDTRVRQADFGGDSTLSFNGFGIPDSGGSVVVAAGSSTRTITVDPLTGTTSIQ